MKNEAFAGQETKREGAVDVERSGSAAEYGLQSCLLIHVSARACPSESAYLGKYWELKAETRPLLGFGGI